VIRSAACRDIPAVEAMLREMYALSKYAGRVEISDKAMRGVLESAVAMQAQNGPQATMFKIAEQGGKPVGFMIGSLARIYNIGNKLVAQDAFLYVRKGSATSHTFRLIDEYITWASANPKVIEINLSWVDALPGAARIGELYRRKGFAQTGEIYELRLDVAERKEAA
jgi:hypothetical protein